MVVGPVIIIIGMGLAPIAVDMSLGKNSAYAYNDAILVSMVTLLTTLSVAVFAKVDEAYSNNVRYYRRLYFVFISRFN